MLKKLSSLLPLVALILPQISFSLGFGDITVFSTLNEPLKVHIELIDSKSIAVDEIIVKNASSSTYRQAHLPKPEAFNKVRFTPTKLANGSIIVVLTSKHPIKETFITFIADMSWRTGRISKEFSFLIDPPEFVQKFSRPAADKKAELEPKKSSGNKKSYTNAFQKKAQSTTRQRTPTIEQSAVISAHSSDNSYLIKKADTLWSIARQVKPDNSVSTYDTMQALFALNPHAFINGNINLIKQGKTLSIPSANEILQLNGKVPKTNLSNSTSKASTTVYAGLKSQKSSDRVIEQPSDKQALLDSESNSKAAQKPEVKDEGRLTIIPPSDELLNRPVSNRNDLLKINDALKTSVSAIKLLKDENDDLATKIEQLTRKMNNLDSDNEKLNTQIAEITTSLENNKTSSVAVDSQEKDVLNESQTTNSDLITADDKYTNDQIALEIDSDLNQPGKPRSFIQDILTNPIITFALAIFSVILLITILLTIRKQNEKRRHRYDNTHPYNKDYNQPQDAAKPILTSEQEVIQEYSKHRHGVDVAVEKNEDEMDFFEYFEKKINAPEEPSEKDSNDENSILKEQSPASEETSEINFSLDISDDEIQDYEKHIAQTYEHSKQNISDDHSIRILSEIDTYFAYGNYDKAEELIRQGVQDSPSDKNLHLKLLECYSLNNKPNEFKQHVTEIANLLNTDMALHNHVEKIYQQTWNEELSI